jgi:hypothetical protein
MDSGLRQCSASIERWVGKQNSGCQFVNISFSFSLSLLVLISSFFFYQYVPYFSDWL